jgi:hypothetical protein
MEGVLLRIIENRSYGQKFMIFPCAFTNIWTWTRQCDSSDDSKLHSNIPLNWVQNFSRRVCHHLPTFSLHWLPYDNVLWGQDAVHPWPCTYDRYVYSLSFLQMESPLPSITTQCSANHGSANPKFPCNILCRCFQALLVNDIAMACKLAFHLPRTLKVLHLHCYGANSEEYIGLLATSYIASWNIRDAGQEVKWK